MNLIVLIFLLFLLIGSIYNFYGSDDPGFYDTEKNIYFHGLKNSSGSCRVTNFYYYSYIVSNRTVSRFSNSVTGNVTSLNGFSGKKIVFSNYDVLDEKGNVYFANSSYKKPFIDNWEQIKSGIFDNIFVYTGSKYTVSDNIKFDVYETEPYYSDSGDFLGYYGTTQKRVFLNSDSPYLSDYFVSTDLGGMYIVPRSVFFNLKTDYQYEFKLTVNGEDVFDEFFVMGEISPEKQEQYEKDKQNALLEEQNKTNKGIWDTLKDVLSYINPFSENFFVYKLIELLIDGLKALFIPSEDFFNNFATDMNEWLSERLGILYYPIDLVVSFLEKISELGDSKTAVIRWPNFEFMGADLLKAGSYDLYSLINENETFKNIHSIYLVFTDVILWLGLVFLAKNTFVDVFGGKYDVDDVVESSSIHDNRTLAKNIRIKEERRYKRGRLR